MLTSSWFVWTFFVFAVLVVIALPLTLFRRGIIASIGRFSHLGFASLACACALLLIINQPMAYVRSFGELRELLFPSSVAIDDGERTTPLPSEPVEDVGPLSDLPDAVAPAKKSDSDYAAWVPTWKAEDHGVSSTQWTGPNSKVNGKVRMWAPPGYSPSDTSKTYSVMVFLHGYPGSVEGVFSQLKADAQMQELINAGTIPPMIIVAPEISIDGKEPSCADLPGAPQAQTWISRDIVKMIRTSFPNVSSARADWLVSGISSGAYCAARTALVHGEVWGTFGSMSGYDFPLVGPLGKSAVAGKDNTISTLVAAPRAFPEWMYFSGTKSDPDSVAVAANVVSAPHHEGDLVMTHIADSGGHNWGEWAAELPVFLTWWQQQRQNALDGAAAETETVTGNITPEEVVEINEEVFGTWAFMGVGWIIVTGLVAAAGWVVVAGYGPRLLRRMKNVYVRYGVALFSGLFVIGFTLIPIALMINRWGQFYSTPKELLSIFHHLF